MKKGDVFITLYACKFPLLHISQLCLRKITSYSALYKLRGQEAHTDSSKKTAFSRENPISKAILFKQQDCCSSTIINKQPLSKLLYFID